MSVGTTNPEIWPIVFNLEKQIWSFENITSPKPIKKWLPVCRRNPLMHFFDRSISLFFIHDSMKIVSKGKINKNSSLVRVTVTNNDSSLVYLYVTQPHSASNDSFVMKWTLYFNYRTFPRNLVVLQLYTQAAPDNTQNQNFLFSIIQEVELAYARGPFYSNILDLIPVWLSHTEKT